MTLQAMLYKSYQNNNDKDAIITDENLISYNELFKKAYLISSYISKAMNFKKKIIPLLFTSSEYYIYGILGILYSKNIFMPLDITHPIDKLRDCLTSLECDFLIVDKKVSPHIIDAIKEINIQFIFIEDILSNREPASIVYNLQDYKEEDDIYIYFTSGSTGKPKAILGVNRSLLHFVKWEINEFNVNNTDTFAQMTSPAFDPYLRDVFTPLCSGAKIQLVNRNIILVPRLFGKFLHNSQITYLHTTPSILRSLMNFTFNKDYFEKLRYMLIAGEVLPPDIVKAWYSNYGNHTILVNLYGPTETTLAKVFARIPDNFSDEIVPVGKPINDTNIYVMNDGADTFTKYNKEDVGEIYIETEYMTHGYYNDSNHTSFKTNNQKKCYATGDLGYIKGGNLYLVGRKDEQKKIGGVRVDLNEIKSFILKYKEHKIEDCIVLYESNLLISFYIASNTIDLKDIRKFLETRLLPIHIPHRFIKVNQFPMSINGKLDKKKLIEEML
ncbi:amino acid adenylation domain-containing protein [Kineothrix alysoides]|uniref:Amino acid adenylation domain-containing protein n=1 Tax=Kineothrix alysoides TaxID=1469948 RepID=A0A4R1QUK0_9FIRM|nr:AMP-binding protein [Kineothrix alysoides]TCL56185.1 amino acid adenylation domain-containing protein [Kineothrix alysoides]